ncbi:porin [Aliiroseovarius sp. S1339]|uniref:porin n=1 Tax=Aliiroseovarius sp. S1339 TaxID=2936990 RepID=UPI0020BEAF61|nr:porin [Aliiroseovarius sp. S1339]MCK8464139.1 porin [Aliiroseovarius sp. S1339]
MKKILFASTALVASAGFAAAEISFGGEAGMGFIYEDVAVGDDWTVDFYTTLNIDMTGETDGGLGFGVDLDLTFDNGGSAATDNQVVYIEGGFGKFSVGTVGSAADATLGLSDIGYSGLGVDNVAEELVDAGDAGNLMYQGTFGDFGVALSHDLNGTEVTSIAATYTMGDFNVGLGYDDWGNVNTSNSIHVKAGANIADFSLNALYSRNSDLDVTSYGVTAGYTMGAVSVTAGYSETDAAVNAVNAGLGLVTGEAYGLGVAYDLGGGASVNAGIAEVGGVTKADMGIIMTF